MGKQQLIVTSKQLLLILFASSLLAACVSSPQVRSTQPQQFDYSQPPKMYWQHIDDDADTRPSEALDLMDSATQEATTPVEPTEPPVTLAADAIEQAIEDPDLPAAPSDAIQPPNLTLQQRLPKADTSDQIPSWISDRKYTFKANDLDIRQALRMFSRLYDLNIYYEPEVSGNITVAFNNLPLKKAMEVILGSHKYYWQWQENLIYVGKFQTRNFVIDYIRLTRTGTNSSNISISNQGENQDSGGTQSTISQGDKISFWDELEKQLKTLVSNTGSLTINKTTGTIQITDTPDRIKQVERFIKDIKGALHRQVVIEARIFEVQLNDDNSLGVDWGEVNFLDFAGVTNTINGMVNGGISMKTATANLTYNDGRFQGMIKALSEQGNVKVMSQPRIRTLNNQPAVIKVGTDRTFFSTVATTTSNSSATQVVTSEKATTVTEGVVLSITPQISREGNIILDVSPVITRIADVTVSQNGSTAPVLDVKQTSTLVQANDGEMVIVGGLIQDSTIKRNRRVPLLGDIPLLGRLFKSDATSKRRTELVICLVAKVIG